MLDFHAAVPRNFVSDVAGASTIVEFGDGVESGDTIIISSAEGVLLPLHVSWGTTSGGADDAPAPVKGTAGGSAGVGLQIAMGVAGQGPIVIRLDKAVKYVKVMNPHATEVANNLGISFVNSAKRGV